MSALYSMAMGKVVLSGANPMGVNDSRTPWLKECPILDTGNSVEELVQQISRLIDEKDKLQDIGLASRQYVEKFHDCVKVAKQYLNVYNDLLRKKGYSIIQIKEN